jgi:catechol 2,3-dioxygenase-like lactoylglutathione lyase family enzyme
MAKPPRIRRVVETALDCDDLPKSAAFYTTLLAQEPMLTSDRLVALDAGEGTVLLLFQRGLSSEAVQLPGGVVPAHDAGGPGHLAFAIDAADIPVWEERLVELGVPVESRVNWERGGFSIYFRDPDNRSVELASPGIWPNY